MPYEYRTSDIGDPRKSTGNKLVVFQIMYPKRQSVLYTLGVWAPTVRQAKVMAREVCEASDYKGCPVVWRHTFTGEELARVRRLGRRLVCIPKRG